MHTGSMDRSALQLILHADDEVANEARSRLDAALQSDPEALLSALRDELGADEARLRAVAAAALSTLDDTETEARRESVIIDLIRSDDLQALRAGLRAARIAPTDAIIDEALRHRGHVSPEVRQASLSVLAAAGRLEDMDLGIHALTGDDDAARWPANALLMKFEDDVVCPQLAEAMIGAEPRGWAEGARHLAMRGAGHLVHDQLEPRLAALLAACEACSILPPTDDPAIHLVRRQAESVARAHLLGLMYAHAGPDTVEGTARLVRTGARRGGTDDNRRAILGRLAPNEAEANGAAFQKLDADRDVVIGWRRTLNEAAERVGDAWLSYGVEAIVDVAQSSGAFQELLQDDGDGLILQEMGAMLMDQSTSTLYDRILTLSGCSIFDGLDLDDLAWIARVVTDRYLSDGERFIQRGEDGDEMFIVVDGAIEVLPEGVEAGSDAAIRLGAGAVVGEMALVSRQPRSADVVASGDTHVLALARHEFTDCLLSHASIALGLLNVLAQRLAAANKAS